MTEKMGFGSDQQLLGMPDMREADAEIICEIFNEGVERRK